MTFVLRFAGMISQGWKFQQALDQILHDDEFSDLLLACSLSAAHQCLVYARLVSDPTPYLRGIIYHLTLAVAVADRALNSKASKTSIFRMDASYGRRNCILLKLAWVQAMLGESKAARYTISRVRYPPDTPSVRQIAALPLTFPYEIIFELIDGPSPWRSYASAWFVRSKIKQLELATSGNALYGLGRVACKFFRIIRPLLPPGWFSLSAGHIPAYMRNPPGLAYSSSQKPPLGTKD